ncbi:TIGR03619 family F420-dependent LLM class oxidoreductase [Saccharopolyspora sp. CA-218241]|uniref:TIGR03619 family F420-dependent LLM class oxidoreductase n=1 Tax=Saccharopolyspora sp. CA-218241 TaxID=3240027 RepID=UPI003D985D88
MRLGLALPQLGPFADPRLIAGFAAEAEREGFQSLWASERVHYATRPSSPYPGGDGTPPQRMGATVDPLLVLAVAATATSSAMLGTSTISAPLHAPVHLARRLAGLEQLSGGRLIAGFGLSWSRDEYEAAGVPWHERGARLDEALDVLNALWGPDPVRHEGRFWTLPEAEFQPKPGPIPIYLGGASPAALRRAGRRGDGWLGVPLPVEPLHRVLGTINEHAAAAGRGPVPTALRINPMIQPTPTDDPATGPVEQLADYLRAVERLGVADVFLDLQFTTDTPEQLLALAGRIRSALG